MKRLISAIIIAVSVAIACTSTQITTKNMTQSISGNIATIMNTESSEEAITLAHKLTDEWHKQKEFLYAFSEHDDVTKVDESIEMLLPHLQQGNSEHFYEECYKTIHALKHIYNTEKPSLSNIF